MAALAAFCAPLYADAPPVPTSPVNGVVVYSPHPHFRWERPDNLGIGETHRIQIARDPMFEHVVCDDALRVVSRFVPVNSLAPARYWWRIRRNEEDWSTAGEFEVRNPERKFTVRAGSDAQAVAGVLLNAARQSPARVDFEPGEYALAPGLGRSLAEIAKARDLIIDGHGAHLVLDNTLLSLNDCQRVTVQNFTLRSLRPGHTLVRVVGKDPEAMSLTVKPEPGHSSDVSAYFDMRGTGGSFMGFMEPAYHGRYLVGAGLSARSASLAAVQDGSGFFILAPVGRETFERVPVGSVAVATAYRWQWATTSRTEECTFSGITLVNMPGAFCGGGNNSARSFLYCRVKRASPQDYYGGHSHTGSGRIGEWIEGCEFECLPDDGPAQQSFRYPVKSFDGLDALILGGGTVRAGDRVALVNTAGGRGASATVAAVKGSRVQLDRPVSEVAAAIRHDASADLHKVFLYCDAQSNEDFVYRRNSLVGGRAHGVKFNGTRAWIADNHFENINGNAVLAGYTSVVSGHGARDVVISGNTALRCGWTPISVWSTSGLGGNIVVCGNRIAEARESAIAVKGCNGVTITDNEFTSSTLPKQGAWITVEASSDIHTAGNKFAAEVPELKTIGKAR